MRTPQTDLAEINTSLAELGCRLWPLDFSSVDTEIQLLLEQPTLQDEEAELVKSHFLLPQQRLLEIINEAGRQPAVPGGGELMTYVSPHDYNYPQLYNAEQGVDYSRFDRFHINVNKDGTPVDEILQLLSGGGMIVHQRNESQVVYSLYINSAGWLLTYSGGLPHIGSLTHAAPGTKVLVQVIGPARWEMRYVDDI